MDIQPQVETIVGQVGQVVLGKKDQIRMALTCLFAGGHLLIEDIPGIGKTTLAKVLSRCLGLKFRRVQFTSDMLPGDILGSSIFDRDTGAFIFHPGPVFTQVLLADEINRATPKTQSAMLEAMQEHSVTVAKATRHLPAPFFVLATQNPLEMEGTYPLPEAQLDRFFFKIDVPFPSPDELVEIAARTTGEEIPVAQPVANGEKISAMQELARGVPVASHVMTYAAHLLTATHPGNSDSPEVVQRYVRYGGSPRGMQAMILSGKIMALLDGRYNVAYDDLRAAALPALRHRLILNFEAQAEGISTDSVIKDLLLVITPEN